MLRRIMTALVCGAAIVAAGGAHGDLGDELFKLMANDGEAGDELGISIAIDGRVVAVGAWKTDPNNAGSTYLFDALTGTQVNVLRPDDWAEGDQFGSSVAIKNGIVAVGAVNDDDNGTASGSAYLFDVSTGTQIAKLLPTDGRQFNYFGSSIGVDNGVVAIGAKAGSGNGQQSGSAYLFDASTGSQIVEVLPNDGSDRDEFGNSIAINDGVLAVGAHGDDDNGDASGAAYLFDATTGSQMKKLLPNDGAAGDAFGVSIAIGNGIVAVGAPGDDDNGDLSGSAYLFDATSGAQIAKLVPRDGAPNMRFGQSIAIEDGIVVVGAFGDDEHPGSTYIFGGKQVAKLVPSDSAAGDAFGVSVAIRSGIVAVGAWGDSENGENAGAAYLFDGDASVRKPATLTDLEVVTGVLLDGDLPELASSDDTYVHTRSGIGATIADIHHSEMVVSAHTGVKAPILLDCTIESRINEPAGVLQVRFKQWNSGSFTFVAQHPVGTQDAAVLTPDILADPFISPDGDIQLSIKHIVFAPFVEFEFESWFDLVEILVR